MKGSFFVKLRDFAYWKLQKFILIPLKNFIPRGLLPWPKHVYLMMLARFSDCKIENSIQFNAKEQSESAFLELLCGISNSKDTIELLIYAENINSCTKLLELTRFFPTKFNIKFSFNCPKKKVANRFIKGSKSVIPTCPRLLRVEARNFIKSVNPSAKVIIIEGPLETNELLTKTSDEMMCLFFTPTFGSNNKPHNAFVNSLTTNQKLALMFEADLFVHQEDTLFSKFAMKINLKKHKLYKTEKLGSSIKKLL